MDSGSTRAARPESVESPWRHTFAALLGFFALLYVWRMSGVARISGVSDHLSNFYLTGAAVTLVGGPNAWTDEPARRRAYVVAAALILVNLSAEVVLLFGNLDNLDEPVNSALGDVNTSDPLDALSGCLGALFVAALIMVSKRARPARSNDE